MKNSKSKKIPGAKTQEKGSKRDVYSTLPRIYPKQKRMQQKSQRRVRWIAWSERPEAIDELCEIIADGKSSLRNWCMTVEFPYNTVKDWLLADAERAKKYDKAREDRADVMFDDILTIADTQPPVDANGQTDSGYVAWLKMRVDARKWAASKLKSSSYGDRVAMDHTGKVQFNLGLDTGRAAHALPPVKK